MSRFARNAALAAALVLGLAAGPAAAQNAPYEINAVLSLTGNAAAIGTHEAQTLQIAEKVINKGGGIDGRPVKFVITDDASTTQNGVQFISGVIAKKAPIAIGSGISSICNAMLPLAEKSGPLIYCLSPIVQLTPGSYMFGASAGSSDIVKYTLRLLRSHGWNKIALITATDASGQTYGNEISAAVGTPEGAGLQIIDRESFNPADISMAAQVARIKAAAPNVIVTYCVGPCFGTLLKSINDAGLNLPVIGSGGNLNYAQLEAYKAFAPKELYLMSYNGVVADPAAVRGVKAAQTTFFDAYRDAGIRVEALDVIGWDPVMVLVEALRKLGPDATAQQLRDYIDGMRSFPGITGTYDFVAVPQRGLDVTAVRAYSWNAGRAEMKPVPPLKVP